MKIILKKSSMEFHPYYPSGTEISVTPVYSSPYGVGSGYYLASTGTITYLAAYLNKQTAVSELISVVGFSKIKLNNLIKGSTAHAVVAFFSDAEQTTGTNARIYSDTEPGSLEINIPENALYIRVNNNTDGGGDQRIGALELKLVV